VLETTSGGTLTHQRDGSFTYTPNNNFNGTDAFTYTATDGTAQSNVATVTIVVRAVNDAPNAADDSAQTETDTPLNINVLANDRDPERDDISIGGLSDPAHGTATLNNDGAVRYAPDTDDYLGIPGYRYTRSDPFTYTVTDGNGGTDTATVTITVTDTKASDAPVITSPANNSIDTDGSFTVSGTAEPNTDIELFDGGNSLNAAATVNADGGWWFELRNVSEGSHSYTAKVTDRAGNTSAESAARTVMVDATAPLVRRVVPQENATGIAPGANVSVLFSEAMSATSITEKTFKTYKKDSTTALAATVTYDAATKSAVLDSSSNLQRVATYKAVVSAGGKDLAGNLLDQNPSVSGNQSKVWSFTIRN
jgi:VCBS repeat-containing protein